MVAIAHKDKFPIILLAVSSDIIGCLGTWSLFPVLGWIY
jgi:hypothetical protein